MSKNNRNNYDVIIIGGGATGTGTLRDCARRGLKALLLERHDIATGTTGRNHGLLHSGARYAVTDPHSAEECIKENIILKKIASHCIESNDGLFISLPDDSLEYQAEFVKACTTVGISAEILDPKEAIRLEPSVNPAIIGAVRVPDGAIDPFRLSYANIIDARIHGAEVLTYHEVVGLIRNQDSIIGVRVLNYNTKEEREIYGSVVVNAAGIWGQQISEYADLKVKMLPAKGSLLIYGHRVNNIILNRCRRPADADILVPGDTITLIGTTSIKIPYEEIDNMTITPDEIDILVQGGCDLVPALAQTRILRAYAGVRPLVASDNDPTGRKASRGIILLDHAERDGLHGFITITGGKLMTYRLMAEWATDLVCKKLNNSKQCDTAEAPLPGSKESSTIISEKMQAIPTVIRQSVVNRHGELAEKISNTKLSDKALVCECEGVSVGEVKYAITELHAKNIEDLRRRTRIGMGTCQGELCSCRAAGIMHEMKVADIETIKKDLRSFLNERWKGVFPIGWGESLRESEYTTWVYQHGCGLKNEEEEK